MPQTPSSEAVPEEAIEWLPGSEPDLTEREQHLVDKAWRDGRIDGMRDGYRIGGEAAVRSMTHLNALLNAEEVRDALKLLAWFVGGETRV